MHSVSDVAALFRAAVSHGLGTNAGAVRVFRRRPRDSVVSSVLEAVDSSSLVHSVSDVAALFRAVDSSSLVHSVSDVAALFRAAVSHGLWLESCCCSSVSEAPYETLSCRTFWRL